MFGNKNKMIQQIIEEDKKRILEQEKRNKIKQEIDEKAKEISAQNSSNNNTSVIISNAKLNDSRYKLIPAELQLTYWTFMNDVNNKCVSHRFTPFSFELKRIGGNIKYHRQYTEDQIQGHNKVLNLAPLGITWSKSRVNDQPGNKDDYLEYDYKINVGERYIDYFCWKIITDGFYVSNTPICFNYLENAKIFMEYVLEKYVNILESIGSNKNIIISRTGVFEKTTNGKISLFSYSQFGLSPFTYDWQCLGLSMAYCNYFCGRSDINSLDDIIGKSYSYYRIGCISYPHNYTEEQHLQFVAVLDKVEYRKPQKDNKNVLNAW